MEENMKQDMQETNEMTISVVTTEEKPKKKWSLKKKLLVCGGVILGLGVGALALCGKTEIKADTIIDNDEDEDEEETEDEDEDEDEE